MKEILVQTLNKIDENFDRNASKKGTLAVTKEEYKENFINTILNINDIIYADMQGEENQYTLYLKKYPASGYYFPEESKVTSEDDIILENDIIPENVILLNSEEGRIFYTMIHESKHVKQDDYWLSDDTSYYISHNRIMQILNEGNSDNQAEYIRDINYNSITKVSEDSYKLFDIIYNKLAYLVGEKKMDEYFKEQDSELASFLSDELDEKYGEGTGLELYQSITNLSFWSTFFNGEGTQKKLDNIRNEIIEKNELIEQQLKKHPKWADYYKERLTVNNNYYEMLNTIDKRVSDQFVEGETDFEKLTMFQRKIELKKLEELTLKCINQDINNISSKNEALDYIQLWDYYRNRCSIPKNTDDKPEGLLGEEETSSGKNFKLLSEVQHNLYEKCVEYGALNIQEIREKCIEYEDINIQDEQLFDKLIEAQLYDLSNASISYLDGKLNISDQYVTNEIFIKEKEDGSRELNINELYTSKGVKGTKILAEKEKKTLKDVIVETKEEIADLER